jgi:single-strand DNA-binding protein
MTITIEGKVKKNGPSETVGTSSTTKAEVVVSTEEQYPQHIPVEFLNEKCRAELDKLEVGDHIKIEANVQGREWVNNDGKSVYFLSLKGWKVESNKTF